MLARFISLIAVFILSSCAIESISSINAYDECFEESSSQSSQTSLPSYLDVFEEISELDHSFSISSDLHSALSEEISEELHRPLLFSAETKVRQALDQRKETLRSKLKQKRTPQEPYIYGYVNEEFMSFRTLQELYTMYKAASFKEDANRISVELLQLVRTYMQQRTANPDENIWAYSGHLSERLSPPDALTELENLLFAWGDWEEAELIRKTRKEFFPQWVSFRRKNRAIECWVKYKNDISSNEVSSNCLALAFVASKRNQPELALELANSAWNELSDIEVKSTDYKWRQSIEATALIYKIDGDYAPLIDAAKKTIENETYQLKRSMVRYGYVQDAILNTCQWQLGKRTCYNLLEPILKHDDVCVEYTNSLSPSYECRTFLGAASADSVIKNSYSLGTASALYEHSLIETYQSLLQYSKSPKIRSNIGLGCMALKELDIDNNVSASKLKSTQDSVLKAHQIRLMQMDLVHNIEIERNYSKSKVLIRKILNLLSTGVGRYGFKATSTSSKKKEELALLLIALAKIEQIERSQRSNLQ